MGVCCLFVLCLVFISCGSGMLGSTSDWPVVENVLVGRVSNDCDLADSRKLPAALQPLDVTLNLLPQGTGFSISWYSMVNASSIIQGGNFTYTPTFQIQRLVTKLGGYARNYSECRTFFLNATGIISRSLPVVNQMSYSYNWTHDNISLQSYDVLLLSLSSGKESDVTNFRMSLYILTVWPNLVALRLLPVCNASDVILVYSPNENYRQVEVGLCDPHKKYETCLYNSIIYYPQNTMTFRAVPALNYEVFVAPVPTKDIPNSCYCGDGGDYCIPCGNQLDGTDAVHYKVPAITPMEWQTNAVLSSWCAAAAKSCCLRVNFSSADASLNYTGYNVDFLHKNFSVLEYDFAYEPVLSVWSLTNEISKCDVPPGLYMAKITPRGACQEWINAIFSNEVTIGEPWIPRVNTAVHRGCDTQDVHISFTMPTEPPSAAALYNVKLCNAYHMDNCSSSVNNTDGAVTFPNVTSGTYSLWLSLAGNCACRLQNTSCIQCPNEAQTVINVTEDEYLQKWNVTINATYREEQNGSTCISIEFLPADQYAFTAYNISVRGVKEPAQAFTDRINDIQNKSLLVYTHCGIYTGDFYIEVTPIGSCPKYIGTVERKIFITKSSSLPVLLAIGESVGVAFGCVFFVAILILGVTWWCKGWSLSTVNGNLTSFHCKQNLGPDSTSSVLAETRSKKEDIDVFIGGPSPIVLLLYANDHEYHVKIVSILAEMLETYVGCKVVIDRWCDSEAVQINDWLSKQLFAADKVVIVASEGACILHQAFKSAQHFPKCSVRYSSCHHISEALMLASKYPTLRQKLVFVKFSYSSDNSVSELLKGFVDQPKYHLVEEMSSLVGKLHNAKPPYKWCCQSHFEHSIKLQKMKKLTQKMLDKVNRRPRFISDSFGPPSTCFDSGIDTTAFARAEFTTDEPSTGLTEVVTIFCSGPEPVNKFSYDSGYDVCEDEVKQQVVLPALPTIIPDTEAIWGTYIEPDPSPAASLTSEQLRVALTHLNRDHPDSFYENHYLANFDDSQSDISKVSCITVGEGQITVSHEVCRETSRDACA